MMLSTLLACLGSVAPLFPAAAPWVEPPAVGAAQDRNAEFKGKLRPQIAIRNYDEVTKLLKSYQDEAVNYVDELAAQMASANSDEIEKEFEMLTKCWKDAFKSDFVSKIYVYHSTLATDPQNRKQRYVLIDQFRTSMQKFELNRNGAKEGPAFELCSAEFVAITDGFVAVGDYFMAARTASAVAICHDVTYRAKGQEDPKKTCEYYGKATEYFEKVDLKHNFYTQCKQRWEWLVREGYGAPAPADPNAPTPPAQPKLEPAAAPVTATTAFEALKSIDDVQRPIYNADDLYAIWPIVPLGAKGSSGVFQSLEKGPLLLRTEPSKVALDFDRDGTADKVIPITGNAAVVDFELGDGAEKRRWAFMFRTGIQQDVFQGLQTNLQPDDLQMRFYVLNAGSVTANVNGVPLRVIDDNMDGIYGSAPKPYSYGGLSDGIYQYEYDCMVVGASKRARPWSKYADFNGAWYQLESQKGGTSIVATPMTLDTGTLKLDFKGPAPTWLILKGIDKLDGCYFDIVDPAKKPISVPAGTYELFAGELRQGKKAQTMKCLIVAGSDTKKWVVKAGAETVVTLGGPFKLDFATELTDEGVTVKGKSVAVLGSARERYERLWNCVPRPEVSIRKAGAKKGGKPEKMGVVLDLLERREDGSYKYSEMDTWRPVDSTFKIEKGDKVELQLSEKKNKLFGELESDWR
jgi:hypothetical protein